MDDKRRVAMVETKTIDLTAPPGALPATVTRYQFDNHLGSAVLELDNNAAIISYEEYYPYGSTSYQAVNNAIEVSAKRYRYTGKERDEETGLIYHGARYYACWLTRWSSADVAGLIDGPNLYRYARDNPIIMIDQGGNQSNPVVDPRPVVVTLTALQRAAQAWGTAGIIAAGGGAALIAVTGYVVLLLAAGATVYFIVTAHWTSGNPGPRVAKPEDFLQHVPEALKSPTPEPGFPNSPDAMFRVPKYPPPNIPPTLEAASETTEWVPQVPRGTQQAQRPAAGGGSQGPPRPPRTDEEELKFSPPRKQVPSLPPDSPARPRVNEELEKQEAQENALTLIANYIKGLGQMEGATVEVALAVRQNGERFLVAGLNSSARWSQAQIDELHRLGIEIAPQQTPEMKRSEGGAPHAEENISAYLKSNRSRAERWSRAVVGAAGSYTCEHCQSIIDSLGGYIEPGFRGR
jgi:RHS repeat-associated protein